MKNAERISKKLVKHLINIQLRHSHLISLLSISLMRHIMPIFRIFSPILSINDLEGGCVKFFGCVWIEGLKGEGREEFTFIF